MENTMSEQGKPTDPQEALRQAAEDIGKSFTNMGRDISASFERAGHMFVVNTALGALFGADEDKARAALDRLPEAMLRQVETQGRRLSRLARTLREARPVEQ
jgi:hypothetical protein